jgi:uncharacterized OsmC-like protein
MPLKHVMIWVAAIMLTPLFIIGSAIAEPANDNPEKKNDTSYKVRVEVKEVQNRIIEGKVRNHTLRIDQPKEFGADDSAPTPPETVAFGLGGCVVSTGRLIATQKKMNVKSISAVVESELDFAKALGIPTDKRTGFSGFKIVVTIDSDMTPEAKNAFLRDITARCPMCDNLQNPTPITCELSK